MQPVDRTTLKVIARELPRSGTLGQPMDVEISEAGDGLVFLVLGKKVPVAVREDAKRFYFYYLGVEASIEKERLMGAAN